MFDSLDTSFHLAKFKSQSKNIMLRFSGHDTFHCKEQWLLKGLKLIENQGDKSEKPFEIQNAIPKLGVGKNMVRSIQHWLKAFNLIDDKNYISIFGKRIFLEDKFDPYLEYEGSLWLMQYYLVKTNYASIFKIIFNDFFNDKATLEFSEKQIQGHIYRKIKRRKARTVTENTLKSDFKVFIKTYVTSSKQEKTIEDDFNAPLLGLNLISDTKRKNDLGQNIYKLNRDSHNVPVEIFTYCLLDEFKNSQSISFEDIRSSVAAYLCLNDERLESLIDEMCRTFDQFVYKDDAGIRQLQVKQLNPKFSNDLLKVYFENEL